MNISYNDPDQRRRIDRSVGEEFSLWVRLRMGGNGSPKLFIETASADILRLLELDNYTNTCNLELRPKGIILRFRSLLETYALVIESSGLSILRNAEHITIEGGGQLVQIRAGDPSVEDFFMKIDLG